MKTGCLLAGGVLFAAALSCAAVTAVAQDLALDDDEGGISLGEKQDKKPTAEELAAKAKADKEARVIARLKATADAATDPREREKAQRKIFEVLKGEKKIDYAISVRNDKATSEKLRVDMARWLAGEIRVEFGIWGTFWYRRYIMNCPDKLLDRYEKEYYLSLDILEELAPKDVASVHRHADALLYRFTKKGDRQDAEKARELFRREIELRKGEEKQKDAYAYCAAWWGYVNAVFAVEGDKAAVEAIDAFRKTGATMNWGRSRRGYTGLMADAKAYLTGETLDTLKLPFHTESKAFPEPQEVEYSEQFAAASAVRIVAKGIDRKDCRFRILEVKYRRYGIEVRDDAPFAVTVEVDPATKMFDDLRDPAVFAKVRERKRFRPVDKDGKPTEREDKSPDEFRDYMAAEGYSLEVTEQGAAIRAKTKQGALWGLVSLIQMTDRDKKAVRIAKLRDWPDVEKRGFLGNWWQPTLEFALFQKMNTADQQRHPCFDNTFEPLTWRLEQENGREFRDFGLDLFYGMNWITHAPQIPICFPRTLPYRTEIMRRYAAAHINVYYPLDDVRYPVCDEDKAAYGGKMGPVDGKHQTAIYRAVVKDYPDWKLVVCPPWYCGPDGRCGTLEEPRDPYLAAWRADLDPGIEAYWTGPRVKSMRFTPGHNAWVLKAYGRRPYLFQNGIGWHNLLDYTIDTYDWPGMYAKGTLDKVLKAYHINAHLPSDCAKITTLGDALWNIGGYDAVRATRRGLAQLMGEKMQGILREGFDDLCYFDKYKYGDCGVEVLEEDPEDLEKRIANIDAAWKKAHEYAKEVGSQLYGYWGNGVRYAHKVLAARRAPRDFDVQYKGLLDETQGIAENETHLDRKKGDVYYATTKLGSNLIHPNWTTPEDSEARKKEHPRLVAQIRGGDARAALRTVSGSFECETFPPDGDYLLCVSAMGKGKVRLTLNGKTVFEGEKQFGKSPKPAVVKFKLPVRTLKRHSSFALENLGKDDLLVTYAVVLTTDRIRSVDVSSEESIIEL